MTTLEHIYAIKEIASNGAISDDFNFSNRFITHLMNVARSTLIEQKVDKYHFVQSFQSLCIDLKEGAYHNCCDIKIPATCTILKSTVKLPKMLAARWSNFVKVTTMDGTIISESSVTQNSYADYSISNKNALGWFIHDNYLYIINNHKLKKVLMNGLWASPEDISIFNCPNKNDNPCFNPLTEDYPIDSDLVDPMYKLVLKYLAMAEQFPQDNVNDTRYPENLNAEEPNER